MHVLSKGLNYQSIIIQSMTTIETNAKKLAQLEKKKSRIRKSLDTIDAEISNVRQEINDQFKSLGLDTHFS